MTPTVESANYSVGRYNTTLVDEGTKCWILPAIKIQGKYRGKSLWWDPGLSELRLRGSSTRRARKIKWDKTKKKQKKNFLSKLVQVWENSRNEYDAMSSSVKTIPVNINRRIRSWAPTSGKFSEWRRVTRVLFPLLEALPVCATHRSDPRGWRGTWRCKSSAPARAA